jgi:hypothetical protein
VKYADGGFFLPQKYANWANSMAGDP